MAGMTIAEITELRRNGQLERALKEAEDLFAQFKNKFTATALYWCLYDIFKKEGSADKLKLLYENMKSLYDNYCGEDELIRRSLDKLETRISTPLFFQLREAIERAKDGHNDKDFNDALNRMWRESTFPAHLHPEYAWLIYYTLKSTPSYEVRQRKVLFHRYLNLHRPAPSPLHSGILSEAIKTKQSHPLQFRFRDFINLWGIKNISEQDWEQFKTDEGSIVTSNVEKLIGLYANELKTEKAKAPQEFSELVDKALLKIKNNQNLFLYKAIVLISQDKRANALDYYKKLILKTPKKFYLWQHAADLVEDINVKICLLCKALTIERNEEFLGNCRLKLAVLLIRKGMYAEAKRELEIYRDFYLTKGWHLKFEFKQIYNSLSSVEAAQNNKVLYERYSTLGDDFVHEGLPTILALKVNEKLVEDKNRKGKKVNVWTLRTKEKTLILKNPTRFGLKKEMPNGTLFKVIMPDDTILGVKAIEAIPEDTDWIKRAEGVVKLRTNVNGKKYCMIADAYIPERFLSGVSDNQRLSVLAYLQEERWTPASVSIT